MAVPNLPVLVFDGDCGFCTRSAEWVRCRLPAGSGASVEPWQRLDLDTLGLTQAEVTDAAWWVELDGRRSRGHLAIAASLRTIGGAWGVVGRALTWPVVSSIAAVAYAVVARYRHKLPGSTPACDVRNR